MSGAPPLLVNPRFWPMFWTQFAGAFNDNFFKNALGILVVYSGATAFGLDSDVVVALLGAVFILPFFLFSATGGQLADKLEKSGLIRYIKVAEIGIMCLAAIGFFLGSVEMLVVVLFLMGTQSAFFGPVKYGILPQLLDDEQIVGGNAMVEMATYLAILGGTIVGGLVVTQTYQDMPVGLWSVAVGLVVLAIVGWGISRKIVAVDPVQPDLKVQWDPIRPSWSILKVTWSNRNVFLAILAITWFWCFGAVLTTVFPTYTKGVLGGNEGIATMFLAAFSVGIASGSILCERLSRHRLELGLVPIGAFGMSLFCLDLWLVGQPWAVDEAALIGLGEFFSRPNGVRVAFDLFMLAVSGGLFIVPLYTFMQLRTEDEVRSRVIAGNNIINSFFMVIAFVGLGAAKSNGFTDLDAFLALAIINALTAVFVFWRVPEFLIRFVIWMISNVFYRVRVVGQENIPEAGGVVVAANHISFVDWFILGGAIRRPVHFVMDLMFAKLPVLKWFAGQGWVIPIASPKRDEVAYEKAFVSIREKLRDGWVVGIFPEGMITEDGTINEFKSGILKIVDRDPVPVVPIAINGLWGSWFSRKDGPAMRKRPRRFWSRIVITIGKPIPPEDLTAESLREAVSALYNQHAAELP